MRIVQAYSEGLAGAHVETNVAWNSRCSLLGCSKEERLIHAVFPQSIDFRHNYIIREAFK